MNQTSNETAYITNERIYVARKGWALALLLEQAQAAAAEGWGPATPVPLPQQSAAEHLARLPQGSPHPLDRATRMLALAPALAHAIWLLVLVELEPAVARVASALHPMQRPELVFPVLRQSMAALGAPLSLAEVEWLTQLGVLMWRNGEAPLSQRVLRASDKLAALATGEHTLSGELQSFARMYRGTPRPHATSTLSLRSALWFAIGPVAADCEATLADLAATLDLPVLEIDATCLASDAAQAQTQLRLIVQEALLAGALPLFARLDTWLGHEEHRALAFRQIMFAAQGLPVLATGRRAIDLPNVPINTLACEPLDATAMREAWHRALPEHPDLAQRAAQRYTLAPSHLMRLRDTLATHANITDDHLQASVTALLAHGFDALATPLTTKQAWEDLVLPAADRSRLDELVARLEHRHTVLDTWGFGDKLAKGLGTVALFSGPPGTGKSMAAALLAKRLGLAAYQINVANISSKYIGETEKNLAKLFDAAEARHAVLLFDEADALFGKRTKVASSNDHFANQQVNFLLQRLETFTGIAILTTNHASAMDPAFMRRLAAHVTFPEPEAEDRTRLWERLLPDDVPREPTLDFALLGTTFRLAPGLMRNAVVRAAYAMAHTQAELSTARLWDAACEELEAAGRIPPQRWETQPRPRITSRG